MIRSFEYKRDAKEDVKEDEDTVSTLLNIKVSIQSKSFILSSISYYLVASFRQGK